MNEIRVKGWTELQAVLFEDSWVPEIERYRSRYAYRGLSDASYPLETTLARLRGDYVGLERHLLGNFRKYAHRARRRGSMPGCRSVPSRGARSSSRAS